MIPKSNKGFLSVMSCVNVLRPANPFEEIG